MDPLDSLLETLGDDFDDVEASSAEEVLDSTMDDAPNGVEIDDIEHPDAPMPDLVDRIDDLVFEKINDDNSGRAALAHELFSHAAVLRLYHHRDFQLSRQLNDNGNAFYGFYWASPDQVHNGAVRLFGDRFIQVFWSSTQMPLASKLPRNDSYVFEKLEDAKKFLKAAFKERDYEAAFNVPRR